MKQLKEFRHQHPNCLVVAFGDLSTGMVLAADTSERTTQEKLDELCHSACECLRGKIGSAISSQFAHTDKGDLRVGMSIEQYLVKTFLAAAPPAEEVLCLVTKADQTDDTLIPDAEAMLQKIVDDA